MENQGKAPTGLNWKAEELFEITGAQLRAIDYALYEEMRKPEMQKLAQIFAAATAVGEVIKKGIDQNKIEQVFSDEQKEPE